MAFSMIRAFGVHVRVMAASLWIVRSGEYILLALIMHKPINEIVEDFAFGAHVSPIPRKYEREWRCLKEWALKR